MIQHRKKNKMIKQNNNLIQNYTDSDLHSFAKLEDFSNYNVVSNDAKKNEKVYQSVDYTLSDKKQFKKLMNFNKNIKTSSIEYFIDNFSYSDDLTDNRTHQETNSFYNESDIENFKNFKKFSFGSSPDTLKYTNKKDKSVDTKINYTVSDLEVFNSIIESKEDSTNNHIAAKNDDAKNLNSNIERSSIKIIDFDELKKKEKIHNKERIEKIKVVYFD